MRAAALYDVHGMLHALEAVLAELLDAGVDRVVFGGDIAAGPFPRETVARVRSLDALCLRGNADRRNEETPGAAWLWEQLDEDDARWLNELPERV